MIVQEAVFLTQKKASVENDTGFFEILTTNFQQQLLASVSQQHLCASEPQFQTRLFV